jgi:hypothetical protein
MAQFLVGQCGYVEMRENQLFICRTQTHGTQFCTAHQWAADECMWLETNVADISIGGEDGR